LKKNAAISFKNALLTPLPTQHNVENQVKLQVLVFNIVWGVGGEVRQVKLYSRLACAQKRQKCQFVPRLLSMIVRCDGASDRGISLQTDKFAFEKTPCISLSCMLVPVQDWKYEYDLLGMFEFCWPAVLDKYFMTFMNTLSCIIYNHVNKNILYHKNVCLGQGFH